MLSSLSPQTLPKSDQQHPSPQIFQEEAVRDKQTAQYSKDQKLASAIWKQTKQSNSSLNRNWNTVFANRNHASDGMQAILRIIL